MRKAMIAVLVMPLFACTPEPVPACDPAWDAASWMVQCVEAGSALSTEDDDSDYLAMQCRAAVDEVCPKVPGFRVGAKSTPCKFAVTADQRKACAMWGKP